MTTPLKALILVTVWPEPESSAAGWRVLNVIDVLKEMGCAVTLASPSKESAFSERLKSQDVEIRPVAINDSSFDAWIREEKFDLAVLDRFIIEEQFGWRIDEHSPSTLRILDTEDLHFLRRARQAALQKNVALEELFTDKIELRTDDACREIASIYRSDLTLILSDHEHQLLRSRFDVPADLLETFRFCYRELPSTPDFEARKHFVTIGNFRHPPNTDGVLWLKREIWPKIRRELPDAEVHIYGAYPSREMMDLTSERDGFLVKGPATEVHEKLKSYRVNFAPLRFGAGIKGKISDGWRAGAPVVTTPIGAEGMLDAEGGFGGLITRNADELAAAAVKLYTDSIEWKTRHNEARRILVDRFGHDAQSKRLRERIENAMRDREARRARNFIGQMLRHETLRSTKYFSRWIELKESRQ